jgi:hypothetical protein
MWKRTHVPSALRFNRSHELKFSQHPDIEVPEGVYRATQLMLLPLFVALVSQLNRGADVDGVLRMPMIERISLENVALLYV